MVLVSREISSLENMFSALNFVYFLTIVYVWIFTRKLGILYGVFFSKDSSVKRLLSRQTIFNGKSI